MSESKSELRWFHRLLRRRFDYMNALFLRGTTITYPQTADALRRLLQAFRAELALKPILS